MRDRARAAREADESLTLVDRAQYALIGAVFGVVYGAVLAVVAMFIGRGGWNVAYVEASTVVFAVLAFAVGPFIGDAIAGALHFLYGIFVSLGATQTLGVPDAPEPRRGYLTALFWFGVATGAAIFVARRMA